MSSEVFRNDLCVAFLDVNPINPGHTLICPIRHVTSFTDLEPDEHQAILSTAQRIARNLVSNMPGCSGVNLLLSDGEDAGQEVAHVHLHVVPRSKNDGFGWQRFGVATGRDELDAIAQTIRVR